MLTQLYKYKTYITLTISLAIILTAVESLLVWNNCIISSNGFAANFFIFILPIFVIHLFGLFDGAQTVRKDAADQSIFWENNNYGSSAYNRDTTAYSEAERWYIGGNDIYPPGNPFKADFWHWNKWMWTLCISLLATTGMMAMTILPIEWKYYTLSYIFMYGVEGFSFTFYYSYFFRKDRDWKWYWNHVTHPSW